MSPGLPFPLGDPWVLAGATLLDLLVGDPPNRFHPVVMMGNLVAALRKCLACPGKVRPLLAGLCIVVVGVVLAVGAGMAVVVLRQPFPWVAYALEIVLLKSTFSLRTLASAASEVRLALLRDDLVEARRLLSWHLVSRNTAELDEPRVAAAAIESVAENASDGIIGPWFFYLLLGLPGALAYRFVNTADSMLGYRDAEREWLGKFPARFDDFLNLVPSRLTAFFLILAAPFVGGNLLCGIRIWWRDAGKTASPNAGQPMAAAAGVLGLELEKTGHYRLGEGSPLPGEAKIGQAVYLLFGAAAIALIVALSLYPLTRALGW